MTEHTKQQIDKFLASKEAALLPSIFIGIQEEDGVFEKVRFRNCLRRIRNISAHDGARLVEVFNMYKGSGFDKVVWGKMKANDSEVSMEISQFIIWMYDMYCQTNNVSYIRLAKSLAEFIFGERSTKIARFASESVSPTDEDLFVIYTKVQTDSFSKYGRIRTVNWKDEYIGEIMEKHPKAFWKIAIPDYFEFILSGLVGVLPKNKKFYEFILKVTSIREGNLLETAKL